MPRVANSGAAVDKWYREEGEKDGNGSSTFDLCRDCADWRAEEFIAEKMEPYNGDPKGDRVEAGCSAPCYESLRIEGDAYSCENCDRVLTAIDNDKHGGY